MKIWGYVGMKEKQKAKAMIDDPALGDCYTFVGIDAETKLILTFETGKRDSGTTQSFIQRLRDVTSGRFQLTTDAFPSYSPAVDDSFGWNIDYGTITKVYSTPEGGRSER